MHGLEQLTQIRSQRAQRLQAYLEPLADGTAWPTPSWLRQAGRTLDEVYVEPDVVWSDRARQPATAAAELRAAVAPPDEGRSRERWSDIRASVPLAVIFGRPGEGKTTLLQRSCQAVALESLALLKRRTVPLDAVPVPIWLRADAVMSAGSVTGALAVRADSPAAGPATGGPEGIREPNSSRFDTGELLSALNRGSTWLFVDALDERPSGVDLVAARRSLESLRDVKAQMLLSVRAYAYVPEDLPFGSDTSRELAVYDLAPLTLPQREAVVTGWLASNPARSAQVAALLDAQALRGLTSNALLLTLLCAAATRSHRHISSETRRVELYAWLAEDLVARADKNPLPPGGDAIQERLLILARAAWTLFQTHKGGAFPFQDWDDALLAACEARQAQRELRHALRDEVQKTGLLVIADGGQRRFFPQTAYEYLAGAGLVQDAAETPQTPATMGAVLAKNAHDPAWREVSLLAVGHLGVVRRRPDLAGAVVRATLEAQGSTPGAAVALMGDALVEAGEGAVPAAVREQLIPELLATLRDDRRVSAKTRAQAGTALGWLGDPRFDSECWYLPCRNADDPRKIDDLLGFVKIQAGTFWMGSDKGRWLFNDGPRHEVTLKTPFYLARWPVTVAQFQAYVRDAHPTSSGQDSLTRVTNHPVVWVSWWEAMAYGDWLTEKLREGDGALRRLAEQFDREFGARGWVVTLPTEAQWEWVARGDDERRYPWGNAFDANLANSKSTGIGATSAVGCFRGGRAPSGVEEQCGNVWEWSYSVYRPYPYLADDGREDASLSSDDPRVVRGGSFNLDRRVVRAAFRDRSTPDFRSYFVGFRVVVSPFRS